MDTVTSSPTTARRFVLRRQGLWPGRRWAGVEGAAEALTAIEGLQLDPLNPAALNASFLRDLIDHIM